MTLGDRPPLRPEDLSIEVVDLDSIAPHPSNPRQGNVGAIVESLDAHGQYAPLVVQRSTGSILAGNHRWLAAKSKGWSTIGVVYVDVDDDEALRIMLADNRTSDLAAYDDPMLVELLRGIAEIDPTLYGTAWGADELDDLLADLEAEIDPTDFPVYGSTIETAYACPNCGYEWSGNPTPNRGDDDETR